MSFIVPQLFLSPSFDIAAEREECFCWQGTLADFFLAKKLIKRGPCLFPLSSCHVSVRWRLELNLTSRLPTLTVCCDFDSSSWRCSAVACVLCAGCLTGDGWADAAEPDGHITCGWLNGSFHNFFSFYPRFWNWSCSLNFELKRKKIGRGIPNDILIDIWGVAVESVIKELPLVDICLRLAIRQLNSAEN